MAETRTTLSITGAGEDYPRLLTAFKRIRGGTELALILKPSTGEGATVRVEKDGTAAISDAVRWPDGSAQTADEAVNLLKVLKRGTPKPGPTTMRGQWTGRLIVDADAKSLRVELTRRIASYGALTVSSGSGGWSWRFERQQKWFSQGGQSASERPLPTLQAAIDAGYDGARGLVREACGFRDTKRRAAFDSGYAEKHPIRPARIGKDRTETFIERERKVARQKRKAKQEPCDTCAADLPPVDQQAPAAPPPKTARQATSAAKKIVTEATALQAITVPGEGSIQAIHDWLVSTAFVPGFLDLAEVVHDYALGRYRPEQAIPVDDFIAMLRKEATKLLKADGREARDATWKATFETLDALNAALTTAPAILARTRALLRYTTAILESPKCTGSERQEAQAAYDKAFAEYERARHAFIAGSTDLKRLRKAAEWVALSAAKAGAACGAGQKSLTAAIKSAPTFKTRMFTLTVPQSANKKAALAEAQKAVLTLLPAGARRAVTFHPVKRGSWTLELTAESEAASNALAKGLPDLVLTAPKPPSPKPSTPRTARPRRSQGSGLSAEKTALLNQAFSSAIADVVRQMRAGA